MYSSNSVKTRLKDGKLWFLLFFMFAFMVDAYPQEKPSLRDRLFFGGNFGLQFGTVTDIQLAPIVGVWLLPRVNVAAGPEYRYYKHPYYGKYNIFGAKAYTEFVIVQDLDNLIPLGSHLSIFAHLEEEITRYVPSSDEYSGFSYNALLGGGGLSFPMGERASLNVMALWFLAGSDDEYVDSPLFRLIFTF